MNYHNNNRRPGRSSQRRPNRFSRKKTYRSFLPDVSKYIKQAKPVELKEYHPTHSFKDFKFFDKLQSNIEHKGYINPTPIQDQAIPAVLEGRDVVGIANTGTGKTAAFILPLIHKIDAEMRENPKSRVLIVVPTRELAMQVEEEFMSFSFRTRQFSACLVGGVSIRRQLKRLEMNNQFWIGTPGRLVDHVELGTIKLE